MTNLIKTVFHDLKRQPVLGVLSVVGTAIAIYLIMIVVMLQDVKTAPIAPESRRDRFLHCTYGSFHGEGNVRFNRPYSYNFIRKYFYNLSEPESVTAYSIDSSESVVSVPGRHTVGVERRLTDANFWRVFDFTFIAGAPYTTDDVDAAMPLAVITESVARSLFGSTDVAGREFSIDYKPMRVCGVVRDVTPLATKAYSQVWLPITCYSDDASPYAGNLSVTMLAPSVNKMDAVRQEYIRSMESVAADTDGGMSLEIMNRPYDQWTETCTQIWANVSPDVDGERRDRMLIYLVLFIVPAVNLMEMTRSRMRRRYAEIGVRRAFGCNRMGVIRSVLAENLVLTLIAGMIGLALAFGTCIIFGSDLFASPSSVFKGMPRMLVSPTDIMRLSTFGWALLAAFILNLLSTGIPAIRASRINIVNALSGNTVK